MLLVKFKKPINVSSVKCVTCDTLDKTGVKSSPFIYLLFPLFAISVGSSYIVSNRMLK